MTQWPTFNAVTFNFDAGETTCMKKFPHRIWWCKSGVFIRVPNNSCETMIERECKIRRFAVTPRLMASPELGKMLEIIFEWCTFLFHLTYFFIWPISKPTKAWFSRGNKFMNGCDLRYFCWLGGWISLFRGFFSFVFEEAKIPKWTSQTRCDEFKRVNFN